MAFIHSPNIITNGLVLCFDAANQKSYGPTTVEALVVAGGGGGGMDMGGGGGGGGLLYGSALTIAAGTAYPIIVGAGGYGGPAGGGGYRTDGAGPQPSFHQFTISATSGGNSSFSSLTAIGGGYGGSSYWGYTPNYGLGAAGGSGGGASGYSNGTSGSGGGAGTAGQGNRGGNVGGQYYSGGGGGAGAAGADGTNQAHGGIGVYNDILGIGYYWAGGGGGAAYSLSAGGNGGLGGAGGGGVGTTYGGEGINNGAGGGGGSPNSQTNKPGGNAGANTGGGGGGGSHYNLTNKGGEGGSGIVVIRYAGVQKATGGTITTVGNYTVHTFTTSGTFTTGANWGDLSGNNITGVLTNGPTYSSANSGSIVFDGVNDYSAIDVSFVSQNSISRTWEAFVKPAVTLTYGGIIGTALSDGCSYYCNGGICIWSGNYAFNWYDNAAYQFLDSGVAATAGVYAHVVGTWNGTDNKARIYVNGVLKNTGAASNLNYGGYANRIQIAYLSASGNYLNGSLGNLKLYYNKVLSDTEVLQNFNAHSGRFGI